MGALRIWSAFVATVFVVMMEATKSAQGDLRAIMRDVKSINTGGRWPP